MAKTLCPDTRKKWQLIIGRQHALTTFFYWRSAILPMGGCKSLTGGFKALFCHLGYSTDAPNSGGPTAGSISKKDRVFSAEASDSFPSDVHLLVMSISLLPLLPFSLSLSLSLAFENPSPGEVSFDPLSTVAILDSSWWFLSGIYDLVLRSGSVLALVDHDQQ
ncbi:hypothetical protein MUK42_33247 [Musa troglodytarum]|uniref:Uncharacterized protein n=1 Tax=Musa troglodytarum TaxID=320322 RepID=A0A9E7I930_9LILI|nr:hypothetical protein MUK42_33247 [Musa troglodytarum]